MDFKLDKKKDWYRNRTVFFREMMNDETIPWEERKVFQDNYKDKVMLECPKTFVDGVAYNDGSWVKYDTMRTKKGGSKVGNIRVRSLDEMIKTLYSYMVFLKMAGIENESSMIYFTVVFFDRLTYQEGLFPCTNLNVERLHKVARIVLDKSKEELTKDWTRGKEGTEKKGCWDDREYCLKTEGMSRSEVAKKNNKVMDRKKKLDDQIDKYYVEGKSIKEMLDILHNNGVKVERRRYCMWLKEHKEAVQNSRYDDKEAVQNSRYDDMSDDEMMDSVFDMLKDEPGAVQNSRYDTSNGAVQNSRLVSERGCAKQTITFINIKDSVPAMQSQGTIEEEKRNSYYDFCSKEEQEMISRDIELFNRKEEGNNTYDLF